MKKQMSDSLTLAVFLTLAGGFQDAYSYNCRGQVFANAQTGDIVLLGQNLATGHPGRALHYLFPLLAFMLGVYLAELVCRRYQNSTRIHWRQTILLAEILLLVIAGLLPSRSTSRPTSCCPSPAPCRSTPSASSADCPAQPPCVSAICARLPRCCAVTTRPVTPN